jgi:two-component system, OmpR family, alkaline phosphatase synthesis response regulator PhoP
MKVLVVDDEPDVVELIGGSLHREGYKVIPAFTGESALELIKTKKPDLVILDLMLPGIQGLDVCKHIRRNPECAHIPILIVSAKDSETDRVLGLEMGADDYITKPFSLRELISRVRAKLRGPRGPGKVSEEPKTFEAKGLFMDFDKQDVTVEGVRIELSAREMKLLSYLARNAGKVFTREQLLNEIWGDGACCITTRNVDVHVSRLRRFIEKNPQKPMYIVTVTSVGYKFNDAMI